MIDTGSEKSAIRKRLREMLNQMTPQQRHARSIAATSQLLSTPEFANAHVIMLYFSMAQEVDTTGIALRAWQEGKQVVAPKLFWNDRTMLPVEVHSLTTTVKVDDRGVREPLAGQPIPVDFIDLVLVPGLGFGPSGQRIGRGGGFYDRFLSQSEFRGVSCGLAFESQMVENLPMLPHDMTLDMLVTDTATRRFPTPVHASAPGESKSLG